MSWRNVKLIFHREVRDQLRDRRTLFMVLVLPLLLYPAMGIGMVQMTVLFTEQPRTVVLLGENELPPEPELDLESEALNVVTDADEDPGAADNRSDTGSRGAESEQAEFDEQRVVLLHQARKIAEKVEELQALETALQAANDPAEQNRLNAEISQAKQQMSRLFARTQMQVLVIIPEGFGEKFQEINRRIAEREATVAEVDYPRPLIVQNSADEKSLIAYRRVVGIINEWEHEILRERLRLGGLPIPSPEDVESVHIELAQPEQLSANLWSKLFPALLVIMAVTGAFYPAIDLAAGEKERGTMETLLICPARRVEIVLGKFFTVMVFSLATALLNLASMGFTGRHIISVSGRGAFADVGHLGFPSFGSLAWLLVLAVPLAALFSALCLSLATFARSSKEGQYYLTPLLMVTLGLTVFCLSPAVQITPLYSLMPVMGPALLLKAMLLAPTNTEALPYVIPVLVTSVGYSLLALWWAIEQFRSEDVLFREAERFELKQWISHLLRDKESTPSFAEAGFCFVMIMLMQFGAMNYMQSALDVAETARATAMMRLLMVQQLVIIATPALLMGVMLTTSMVRTFRLRLPSWRMLAAAAVLPAAMHVLSLELSARMQWVFEDHRLPEGVTELLAAMSSADQPLWFVLLTFAFVPAVCEELAFRGFILSGFGRSGRTGLAIGLSALTFGLMHMIPQQVFNAALLGIVLGLIAVRSRSLLPCVLFHFMYNGLEVLRSRFAAQGIENTPLEWIAHVGKDGLQYEWHTLATAGGVAFVLLWWLVKQPSERKQPAETSPTVADPLPVGETGQREHVGV